jgi:hypothetical protein
MLHCATSVAFTPVLCLQWVMTDKTQSEQNESALSLKADVRADIH